MRRATTLLTILLMIESVFAVSVGFTLSNGSHEEEQGSGSGGGGGSWSGMYSSYYGSDVVGGSILFDIRAVEILSKVRDDVKLKFLYVNKGTTGKELKVYYEFYDENDNVIGTTEAPIYIDPNSAINQITKVEFERASRVTVKAVVMDGDIEVASGSIQFMTRDPNVFDHIVRFLKKLFGVE